MIRAAKVVVISALLTVVVSCLPERIEAAEREGPPGINTIYPPAIQRGVATPIQCEGKRLGDAAEWVATFAAEVEWEGASSADTRFIIKPAADTVPGIYAVRVRSRRGGISNLRFLQVTDVPVIRANRSTSEYQQGRIQYDQAQPIAWPAIIAGHRLSQDTDLFRLGVDRGQRLTIVTETRRLGLTPDPILWLRDAQGRQLTYVHDTPGLRMDERLDYTFTEPGDCFLQLKSFGVSGWNNHYLLRVGDFDYVRTIYPLGGRRGQKLRIEVLNRDGRWSSIAATVPTDRFDDRWRLPLTDFPGSLPWVMASGDLPEVDERGNSAVGRSLTQRPSAQPIDWPVTVNGRIDQPGEGDRYRIAVQPGQHVRIMVDAFYLGSHLDGYLLVYDLAAKKLLAKNDDQRYRGNPDPALTFEVPATTREVIVELRDTRGYGGVEFPYRMTIERGGPDFYLWLGKPQNPYTAEHVGWYKMDPSDTLNMPIGREIKYPVSVRRKAKQEPTYTGPVQDYQGPIRLRALQVPRGVTIKPTEIAVGQTTAELSCLATADAPREPFEVVVIGEATREDGTVIRRIAERKLYISDASMTLLTWNWRVRKLVCAIVD